MDQSNFYETLMRYFNQMEYKLFISMGKNNGEIEKIHQADLEE